MAVGVGGPQRRNIHGISLLGEEMTGRSKKRVSVAGEDAPRAPEGKKGRR